MITRTVSLPKRRKLTVVWPWLRETLCFALTVLLAAEVLAIMVMVLS